MTWRNILDIPDLTYSVLYDDVPSLTPALQEVGDTLSATYSPGDDGWYKISVTLMSFDAVITPCNMRIRAQGTFTAGNDYLGVFHPPDSAPANPNITGTPFDVTLNTTCDSGSDNFYVQGFDGGTRIDSLILTVELDGDLVAHDRWTNYNKTEELEDIGLVKSPILEIDPGQIGQPFIPPSHTCYAVPPPPPEGGGTDPPGGGGSGPPDGDLPVCQYQWVQNTDGNGDPLPGGMYVPINAPCRVS